MPEQMTEADQQALAEFYNSTAPMSQVRENMNLANGEYDIMFTELTPCLDDNGLIYIQGKLKVLAPASVANLKVGNTHQERFYIGSKLDPKATLPETRLNSPGFSRLKGIARACGQPTNDQPVAQLCANILNKPFSNRIATEKDKKSGKEYCNMGRNPRPVGLVPPRLDSEGAMPGGAPAGGATAPLASAVAPVDPAIAGATFGNE